MFSSKHKIQLLQMAIKFSLSFLTAKRKSGDGAVLISWSDKKKCLYSEKINDFLAVNSRNNTIMWVLIQT